jgi:hypothetical protein
MYYSTNYYGGHVKPIHLSYPKNLHNDEYTAVKDGIKEIIQIAGSPNISIKELGDWQQPNYKTNNGLLKPYKSYAYFLAKGYNHSLVKGSVNTKVVLDEIEYGRKIAANPTNHYDVFVTHDKLNGPDNQPLIGYGSEGLAAIISYEFLNSYDYRTHYDIMKTLTMHELGHMFGLVYQQRNNKSKTSSHCTNLCIMHDGDIDVTAKTYLRKLTTNPFCSNCTEDLRNYFTK